MHLIYALTVIFFVFVNARMKITALFYCIISADVSKYWSREYSTSKKLNFRGICIVVNEKADFDLSYVIKWKNVICVIFVRTNGRRYVFIDINMKCCRIELLGREFTLWIILWIFCQQSVKYNLWICLQNILMIFVQCGIRDSPRNCFKL